MKINKLVSSLVWAFALALFASVAHAGVSVFIIDVADGARATKPFKKGDYNCQIGQYTFSNSGNDNGNLGRIWFATEGVDYLFLKINDGYYGVHRDGISPEFVLDLNVVANPGVRLDITVFGNILPNAKNVSVRIAGMSGSYTAGFLPEVESPIHSAVDEMPRTGVVNSSTMANLSPNQVVVHGFSVAGRPLHSTPVLVRVVGSLSAFGIQGGAADPVLFVYDSNGNQIAGNDNWSGLENEFVKYGAFALPKGSKDAAVLLSLPPGNYTVQGKGDGKVLIEEYFGDEDSGGVKG